MNVRMEQSYTAYKNQKQGVVPAWTQQSILPNEASERPSQSASSVIISPGSDNSNDALSKSSGQSSSSLKERDYIGWAEISSASSSHEPERDAELNLAETELRLGLGPTSEASITCVEKAAESLKNEPLDVLAGKAPSLTTYHKPDATEPAALNIRDDVNNPSILSTWQSTSMKTVADTMPIPHTNGFQGTGLASAPKNGGKRMFAEAMVNASRDCRSIMNLGSSTGALNACDLRSCANQTTTTKQLQDLDKISHAVHLQGVYWVPPHVPSWQPQANYRPLANQKGMVFASASGEKDGEVSQHANLDLTYCKDNSRVQPVVNEENVPDGAPPAKGQVVGWPPVRSSRRSTLAIRSKPTVDNGDGQSAIYVKVNMDGIPIGRKVDLKAYKSYGNLLSALEDMFPNPNSGVGARFLKGSEFVLIYEDKEGDWMLVGEIYEDKEGNLMLVGDMPWGTFVNTVRRLRITRGSEMTGLGSRTACHR